MGQLAKTVFADNAVLTHTNLNDLQDAAMTAHNTHAVGDFPADCIPVTAVANDHSTFTITLTHAAAVGTSQGYTDQQNEGLGWIPASFTLVSVTAVAASVTTGCGVKLYYNGAAASNAIELAANYTGLQDSAPVVVDLVAGKLLELRFETGGAENCSGITVILECKKEHVG